MNCALAIFVKTPALSPVKSRLWAEIGRENAERLYLASAAAVCSVVPRTLRAHAIEAFWAIAESAAIAAESWPDLTCVEQGQGSLGERMAEVYRQLRAHHHAAILIGADAPQLTSLALDRAAEWLASKEPRLVIGRAEDGGFWLFGGNQALPDSAWTLARYSMASTAVEFMQAMNPHGHWLELETLRDIDTAADIAPVQTQLEALEAPTPAQLHLASLLNELSHSAEKCA